MCIRDSYVGACYGMYFAEVADFYCRENNDEKEMMKLVYQSLRALCAPALPNELVRSIFELKAIVVNGEYPGVPEERKLEESTRYALNYIAESSVEKLYTFTVSDKVLAELSQIASEYRKRFMDLSLIHIFVDLTVGAGREHNAVAQFGEEGEPERIVLVHIQHSGDTNYTSGDVYKRQISECIIT